jgi:hypothetical protein
VYYVHAYYAYIERDGRRETDRQTERERERERERKDGRESGRVGFVCAIRALPLELEEAKKEHFFLAAAAKTHFTQKKKSILRMCFFYFTRYLACNGKQMAMYFSFFVFSAGR